jgi:hypothetical protein
VHYPARVTEPKDLILALFQHTWGPSLAALVKPNTPPLSLPAELLSTSAGALASASEHEDATLAALIQWFWSRNQFVELDEDSQAELADSVETALHDLEALPLTSSLSTLSRHRNELAAFVRTRFGSAPREVVCSEYSPELQLQILGLRIDTLKAPVLDIGCGPSAALVQYLRAHGVESKGLDRALAPGLGIEADWLSFAYQTERPGMALSHLGFSLHFLHHHLTGGDSAFAYARTYMNILRALRPLGSFCYTPGLPFIESMLDTKLYRVEHVPFASELRVASLTQIEAATGLSLSHATHVARVS